MDLALFDFDGTITTRELFPDFVRSAVPRERLRRGQWLLAPWIAGYKLGLVSGTVVRAKIVDIGFRGVEEADYLAAGERFVREIVQRALRPEAMTRIDWHRQRGDTIAVVSGAFDAYLTIWCRQQGLDCICSRLEATEGVLTGRYVGAQCVAEEKPRRVGEQYDVRAFDAIYAYGDTKEDMDLLAIAQHRWYRWKPMA
jgi:phosphatidylglycerophosphatase C